MAKQAKAVASDFTDKDVTKATKEIIECYGAIETARGKFMLQARREAEAIEGIIDTLTTKGITKKAAKTHIKIYRLLDKVHALVAELDVDDRKIAEKMAKAQGGKQLSLMLEVPKPKAEKSAKPKAKKEPKPVQTDIETSIAESSASASQTLM